MIPAKKFLCLLLLALLFLLPAGAEEIPSYFTSDDLFSKRDFRTEYDPKECIAIELLENSARASDASVKISGSRVTITDEGTYLISGKLQNGAIIVDAGGSDKVQLILNGASIHCETSAPIYILKADKVFITLAENTTNTLSNGGQFKAIDSNNIDSVIFSKEDLSLNGDGLLSISSPGGHGVVSKDDLVITGGEYQITSASHGLSGKDSLRIAGGKFMLETGKDGLHAEHDEDAEKGYLYIADGSFTLNAQGDGVSASGKMQIDGGAFQIKTGEGAGEVKSQSNHNSFSYRGSSSSKNETSMKALKAADSLLITGGNFQVDSQDDAFHSNNDLTLSGGQFHIATGDDAFHADSGLAIHDGHILITQSYEGLEGQRIDIYGGDIDLTASDDGLNAAGGNDQSGFGGRWGGDMFAVTENCYIAIAGGRLLVNASGDGIDSNGHFSVSGGETYVSGPTGNGNGALDFNGDGAITGGIFLAAGSSGMAQSFGAESTQGVMLISVSSSISTGPLSLCQANGQELLSWQSNKKFEFLVISHPALQKGETYTLSIGEATSDILMEQLVYTLNRRGPGGGGRPGRP